MAQAVREKEVSFLELLEEVIIKNNQLYLSLNMVAYKWMKLPLLN